MGSIISSILNSISGDLNAVRSWIAAAIASVVGYIDNKIDEVSHDVSVVYDDVVSLADKVGDEIVSVYNYAVNLGTHVIVDLANWANDAVHDLENGITSLSNWAVQTINDVINRIDQAYHDIETWVLQNIWNPLWAEITKAANWIANEGLYVYNLLTHPDQLAQFLGKYLWDSYLDLLKKYAGPIARWLLHSMMDEASAFVDVLEAIIAALI